MHKVDIVIILIILNYNLLIYYIISEIWFDKSLIEIIFLTFIIFISLIILSGIREYLFYKNRNLDSLTSSIVDISDIDSENDENLSL